MSTDEPADTIERGPSVPLVCPACLGRGDEVPIGDLARVSGEMDADLECSACGEAYPVIAGIAVLVPSERRTPENYPGEQVSAEYAGYETEATRKVAGLVSRYSRGLCLDLGCGKGPYSDCFRGDLVLADRNYYFVREALDGYGGVHRAFGAVVEAAHLPFPESLFDFTFCSSMLEHLPADEVLPAIAAMKRVSRDRLQVDIPNASAFAERFHSLMRRLGVFTSDRYEDSSLMHTEQMLDTEVLRREGFQVHGCIGWVGRERIKIGSLWDVYDLIVWRLPALAGTHICTYVKTPGRGVPV
ncbi:MAG: methyltransferase domain-containing protein [Actinobacteria bacterium]|nr:methyltransferase domain-containing protein [Actinomycetota bacterium]